LGSVDHAVHVLLGEALNDVKKRQVTGRHELRLVIWADGCDSNVYGYIHFFHSALTINFVDVVKMSLYDPSAKIFPDHYSTIIQLLAYVGDEHRIKEVYSFLIVPFISSFSA
jgi:hypothetical protein